MTIKAMGSLGKHKKLESRCLTEGEGQVVVRESKPSRRKRKAPSEDPSSQENEFDAVLKSHKTAKKRKTSTESSPKLKRLKEHISVEAAASEPLTPPKKTVKFAEVLVTPLSQPSEPQRRPKVSILKSTKIPVETPQETSENTEAEDAAQKDGGKEIQRPKKSKNAIKRIKWVKRHRKKTLSRRRRRANRNLALSRPPRSEQEHAAEAVDYLNAWYSSPVTWKYKKVPQLNLIKHAFNQALIDEETFELLLHYLAGIQGVAADRLRLMCQQIIESGGVAPETTPFPLSIPSSADPSVVIDRATKMLHFVLPSSTDI